MTEAYVRTGGWLRVMGVVRGEIFELASFTEQMEETGLFFTAVKKDWNWVESAASPRICGGFAGGLFSARRRSLESDVS